MDSIQGLDRLQQTFLPADVDEYVTEDNPVRVIDAFVNSLNMAVLEFKYSEPKETGRPAYKPGLFGLELFGIDGSKFTAVNHTSKVCTKNKLDTLIKEIDNRIDTRTKPQPVYMPKNNRDPGRY